MFKEKNESLLKAISEVMSSSNTFAEAKMKLLKEKYKVISEKALTWETRIEFDKDVKKLEEGTKVDDLLVPESDMINEEDIQELSKKTLDSYKEKAHASFNYHAVNRSNDDFAAGPGKNMTDVYGKKKFTPRSKESMKTDDKEIKKRLTGLKTAYKKTAVKEEEEEKEYGVDGERSRAARGERYDKVGKIVNKIRDRKAGKTDTGKKADVVTKS